EQGVSDPPEAQVRKLAQENGQAQTRTGDLAPNFSLQNERGDTVKLSSMRDKIVVLYWFASWSQACGKHAAELEGLIGRKFRSKGVQVLGIQIAEDGDAVAAAKAYRQRYELGYPILIDMTATTFRQLRPGEGG